LIGLIIQARMGSSRLPGKVMMQIDGKNPLLYYAIKQNKVSKYGKNLVIATTTKPEDDIIEEYAKKNNIMIFRGSSENVLDRYYQCAKKFSFSIIVRLTGDNPFNDPTVIDAMIKKYQNNSFDFISTGGDSRYYPEGIGVEVFSFDILEDAWKNAILPSEKEHVTSYFYNNPQKFRCHFEKCEKNYSSFRWTVDREDDLQMVREICKRIKKSPILIKDIINLFEKESQLRKINSNHIPNEGYIKSLKEDEDFLKSKN